MKRVLPLGLSLALAAGVLLPLSASAQHLGLDAQAPTNKLSDGGFEEANPSYWEPTGSGATWTEARSRTASRSLMLSGSGAAEWTMGEAVRNWTGRIAGNADLEVGAYVWTEGVNTNPASDAEKFQMVVEFFNAAGGTSLLSGPVVLDLPQTSATTGGWTRVSTADLGSIVLPSDALSARISFRKGASATGTVYIDDLFITSGTEGVWPGDVFNANVDVPGDWYYWWDGFPTGGDWPANQPFEVGVTSADAHTGDNSLRIRQLRADASEAVAVSQRVDVTPGEPVMISFWVKTEGNEDPGTIGTGDNNIGLTALWYTNMTGGAAGYGEVGGVDIRLNGEYNPMVIPMLPQQAANGWKQYAFVVTPPVRGETEEPVVGMELRLRYWHAFTGATYWDDVFIGDVADVQMALPNLLATSGGFEPSAGPSYWEASGSGAMWSDAVARSEGYSLELTGSGAASWTMGEAVRNWTDYIGVHGDGGFTPGEIVMSAYVRAEGVNTNPTTDAQKYQLVFEFFDAPGGTDILGGPVVLDLPQTDATMDWTKVTTEALGAISLPQAARSVRITFRKGAEATGAMYLDDLTVTASGGWPGTIHNGNVDAGGGWYYYTPDAEAQYPNGQTFVNSPAPVAAFSDDWGLRIARIGEAGGEAVHISERVEVNPGEPVLISFRMRTAGNANPETIGTGDNNVGLTGLWYTNMEAGAAGYGEVGGFDVRFNGEYNDRVIPRLPQTADSDWRHYAIVANPPVRGEAEAPVVGMELRLRYWHAFTGDAHFDDVFVTSLGGDALVSTAIEPGEGPDAGGETARLLLGNMPNPFSRTTTLAISLPQAERVTLEVYDLLGRRVATLINGQLMSAGTQLIPFDAERLPAGTYLYVLRAGERTESRAMTLVR